MASGLNESERLKAAGVPARKGSVTKVPLNSIMVPTAGEVAHPRWSLPLDEDLIAFIMKHGVPGRFTVREAGIVDDVMMLQLCDGSRRTKNGLEAQARLQKLAPRKAPLIWDKDDPRDPGVLYAEIHVFNGTDAEFLLERLRTNSEPGKLPDSTEVLAITVKQLAVAGCEDIDAIVGAMPRGVTKKDVQALARWDNLMPEVKARWIREDLPVGLLAAVLDAPRDKQMETLNLLVSKGITSSKGATRTLNTQREEKTGQPRVRKFTPAKLAKIAKRVAPENPPKLVFDPDEKGYSARDEAIFRLGMSAGLNLGGAQKTGSLPTEVSAIIREIAKGEKPTKKLKASADAE